MKLALLDTDDFPGFGEHYPTLSRFIALLPCFHNHMLSFIHLIFLLDSLSKILHSSQFIMWFSLPQCSMYEHVDST